MSTGYTDTLLSNEKVWGWGSEGGGVMYNSGYLVVFGI